MTLETLEKLLAYIDLVKYGPFAPRAKARDELRALVKAESDSAMAEKAMSDYREGRALDKIYEPEGGDAHMPSRPLDGKLNPPSDVQAEGRGELLGFTEDEIVRAIYLSELSSHSAVSVKWNDGIDISRPSFAMLGFLKTLSNIRKMNDASNPPPHDPDNLPHDGNAEQLAKKRKEAGK